MWKDSSLSRIQPKEGYMGKLSFAVHVHGNFAKLLMTILLYISVQLHLIIAMHVVCSGVTCSYIHRYYIPYPPAN